MQKFSRIYLYVSEHIGGPSYSISERADGTWYLSEHGHPSVGIVGKPRIYPTPEAAAMAHWAN
jgi:hypothetical protein